jgi:hypothetical protein
MYIDSHLTSTILEEKKHFGPYLVTLGALKLIAASGRRENK